MSGNSTGAHRWYPHQLRGLDNDTAGCDRCGGDLREHEWAWSMQDAAGNETFIACSGNAL